MSHASARFLSLMLCLTLGRMVLAAEPKVISPEEAKDNVGTLCQVTFRVRHAKHGVHRRTWFLDSKEDFKSPGNLGVQISDEMAAQLKAKKNVPAPDTCYADRTIRVLGTVFLQEERPYLKIEDVEHILLVEDAGQGTPGR